MPIPTDEETKKVMQLEEDQQREKTAPSPAQEKNILRVSHRERERLTDTRVQVGVRERIGVDSSTSRTKRRRGSGEQEKGRQRRKGAKSVFFGFARNVEEGAHVHAHS